MRSFPGKQLLRYIIGRLKWGRRCKFGFSTHVALNSRFEGMNKIYPRTIFKGEMGLGSYVSHDSDFWGKLGRFCSVASRVEIITGVHPYTYPYVSTSPYFFSPLKQNGYALYRNSQFEEERYADEENKFPVVVGNDCWIGQNAKIISGVTIGDGAMILAGAIVTKDVPPYAIVGGVPAKVMRYRYNEETINRLLEIKWWNMDLKWLKEHKGYMMNIEEFLGLKDLTNGGGKSLILYFSEKNSPI